jgi:hypothetical protein
VYTTEKTYVGILYILSVKISSEVKRICGKDDGLVVLFNNTYRPLLGSLQSIYKLHYDVILVEFEKYITGHSKENIWTVLGTNLKVIESIYKDYYVKYAEVQGKLDDLCKRYPSIHEAMLQCQTYLGNLYPLTQLNCANQRLLRYEFYDKYEHSCLFDCMFE